MSVSASLDGKRNLADYHPTVWGDYFINYDLHHSNSDFITSWMDEVNVLKEEVRKIITSCDDKSQVLSLVDLIQRLGIGSHFEIEIEKKLKKIFSTSNCLFDDVDDLPTVALGFRLLRQRGHYVPTNVFDKFKDCEGKFIGDDVQGLLSLYEASFLSVDGEDTLDEALTFAMARLKSTAENLTSPLTNRITHALKYPIHRNIEKEEAWHCISMYEQDEGHVQPILKLAKLDFNIAQRMQIEELMSITMWWKERGFATKLSFARDRIVEGFVWPIGVFTEPKCRMGRKMLAKAIALFSVIDDIYDAYGTLEELQRFTKTVESFDISNKGELPEYMQFSYQALFDVYKEYEEFVTKEGGPESSMFYVKELTKKLLRAYLTEARWLNENYVPTVEEYLENGYVTSGYPVLTSICFLAMGEFTSNAAFEWLLTEPKILQGAAFIGRLMDDLVSNKFKQSRGHVASAVECYIKQHGVSEKEARCEINKLVAKAWKDINEDILKPTDDDALPMPMPLKNCMLNLARIIYLVYKDGDGYTNSKNSNLKNVLETLLLKPLPI